MLQKWRWAPLAIAMTITLFLIGHALREGERQPVSKSGLPKLRYRIHFLQLPADAIPGHLWIYDMNNAGEVVGVYNSSRGGISGFLYAPTRDATRVINLNDLTVDGIPQGAKLQSGNALNDWGVVVGALQQANGDVHPFALDLRAETPVVDLLPHLGASLAKGTQINEHGDIVVQIKDPPSAYVFNPGLYNEDPAVHDSRDNAPRDLRKQTPHLLPAEISRGPLQLNNPFGSRPAQIAGVTNKSVVFRYTTGKKPRLEMFPMLRISNIRSQIEGLNDAGVICGQYFQTITQGIYERRPFRYGQALELLSGPIDDPISDFNATGDLIAREHLYRDDWGVLHINDIVTGADADISTWNSGYPRLFAMTDRRAQSDASNLVGLLEGAIVGGEALSTPLLFVLTPEPAPAK